MVKVSWQPETFVFLFRQSLVGTNGFLKSQDVYPGSAFGTFTPNYTVKFYVWAIQYSPYLKLYVILFPSSSLSLHATSTQWKKFILTKNKNAVIFYRFFLLQIPVQQLGIPTKRSCQVNCGLFTWYLHNTNYTGQVQISFKFYYKTATWLITSSRSLRLRG